MKNKLLIILTIIISLLLVGCSNPFSSKVKEAGEQILNYVNESTEEEIQKALISDEEVTKEAKVEQALKVVKERLKEAKIESENYNYIIHFKKDEKAAEGAIYEVKKSENTITVYINCPEQQ